MYIELDNMITEPLAESISWRSEVWRRQVCFSPGLRYQLDAPSGNGKTSLIHILCGLRRNYLGQWTLDGRSGTDLSLTEWCELRRQRLAVMFQDLRLFPELTVTENVRLKTVLAEPGFSPTPEVMLEALGLRDCGERLVGTLSWGERQRVALVRTLSQPFSLLLLDEPFSHLDSRNIKAACRLIDEACSNRSAGCIMTSLGYDYPLTVDRRMQL